MAIDKLVDSSQLDSDLTSVANAIRAKSGGSGQLAFPAGFVSEIGNIPSGGTSRRYIIKDGKIQTGFTFSTTNNITTVTEETGTDDYVKIHVEGNEYGGAYVNGVDFTNYNSVFLLPQKVSNYFGSSYAKSGSPVCPTFSAGNGNAPSGTDSNSIYKQIGVVSGNITIDGFFLNVGSLSSGGNIKIFLSGYSAKPYADLFIKDLYLDSFTI